MANISTYLANIMNAVYGEEVRSSIHDAINAINTESESTKSTANQAYSKASEAETAIGSVPGIEHRNHWRGQNLGSSVTADQWTAISNGRFTDLFVGDFWMINNVYWQIMDFDYWYKKGTPSLETHHAVIVPSGNILSAKMNDNNTTEGGYYSSKMNTVTMPQILSTIESAFGASHIVSHYDIYSSTVNSEGKIVANTIVPEAKVSLMDEIMVYGCRIKNLSGENKFNTLQLAGMGLRPYFPGRAAYWLRDVGNANSFVCTDQAGLVFSHPASNSIGVRPVFAIGVNS